MKNPETARLLCMVAAVLVMSFILPGCGTIGLDPQIKAEVLMTGGDTVQLFYDGPQDAKDMFCIGETVTVYAASSQNRSGYIEVGKLRIVRSIDEKHLEAIVVEGKLKEGDLARKCIAACKVMPRLSGRD